MNHSMAPYLKGFFSHYLPVQRGLSPNTVLAYRDAVKLLLCYAADTLRQAIDTLTVESLTTDLVSNFLDHIEQIRSCTTATRNARLAAIRTLFLFVAREEPELIAHCQAIRAIPIKRTTHQPVRYLEEHEMQALLDAIDIHSRTGVRDRALLMMLYNTGARVSELTALNRDDLRLSASTPQIRLLGKGRKQRSCPIWPETVDALTAYLQLRVPVDSTDETVFLNANGAPITRFGVRHIIRKYAARALPNDDANPSINPHTIRHTTAMHLLRAGNEINMISYWLGHADINTSHVYVEIDMEMKRKMIARVQFPSIHRTPSWKQPEILQWLQSLGRSPQLCGVNPRAGGSPGVRHAGHST